MSTRTLPGGTRRWLSAGALAALLVTTTTACYGTWGVRESYRTYINGPIADGNITTEGGATWLDGTGAAKGPFQWSVDHAEIDPVTETGYVQFRGGVHTNGHPTDDGYVMETSFWNPRLELDGDVGTLVVDLNYRPYVNANPNPLPALQAAIDVDFATVDLSGFSYTTTNGTYKLTNAPMTGIDAAMSLISWNLFYGSPVALDPMSFSFSASVFAPALVSLPRITVSQTTGLRAGDTIIVSGSGFDPSVSGVGVRPPMAGVQSGSYVVFGKFLDAWQPSTGAASSTRTVIDQKWALPPASRALLDPTSTNAGLATIDQYGNFQTTVLIGENAAAGNYGIYSYPASGAVNATYELATPVTLGS